MKPAAVARTVLAGLYSIAAAALSAPLPRVNGRQRLPQLRGEATVLRDPWGVPHISAQHDDDLLQAQGYIHAQDRLWQMEFQRRLGWGQLAELLGPAALPTDRAMRVLGLGRLVRRETALLTNADHTAAEAYARGVNAWIAQNGGRLPVEFRLLRARPAPWSVADVLMTGKLLALHQSESWAIELLRAALVDTLGAARASACDPRGELVVPDGVAEGSYQGAAALLHTSALPLMASAAAGSSAWAVNGTHTISGRPLLASDAHTRLCLPAPWYENHLDGGELHVAGASLPGMPGVLIGHNQRIAWGLADALCDVQDIYIERFDPHDPTRYQFREDWEQAEHIRETIAVRGQADPWVETVRITRHGPIVSALAPPRATPGPPAGPWEEELALRWTALTPGPLLGAVLALNRAHDWPGFCAALAGWTAPALHMVYADTDGHIGAIQAGAVPVRAAGDGRLPAPGWAGAYEWASTPPPAAWPRVFDPPSGVVVVAGGQLSVSDTPAHAQRDHGRAARIHSLLGLSQRHTRHSFAQIQNDRLSPVGLELAALAGRLSADTSVQRAARARLAAWDGQLNRTSAGAAIYARLRHHLLALLYPELAAWPAAHYLARGLPGLLRQAAAREPGGLPAGQSWDGLLETAWHRATAELQAAGGTQVRRWHDRYSPRLWLLHPLGLTPLRARLFNRGPFATAGQIDTLAAPTDRQADWVGSSYRQICDLDDWDNSESIYAGGQSGHPASRHYDDLVRPWLAGRYHPLLWTYDTIEEATTAQLILSPLH